VEPLVCEVAFVGGLRHPEIVRLQEKMKYAIPFNRPSFEGNEQSYIAQAIASGQISGDGVFTRKCHAFLEQELNVSRALLTTSCTHALEMAALLLNIQPGDEVIVPSFTFVSTANAFALRGARVRFADIRPDTLNLDESRLEELVTSRTKAIVPVHYAGVGCEMNTIQEIAERRDIAIVEDNAHGLFGKYKGKYLGTFGVLAAQSFHETKNFTCGEGGALLVNNPAYIERAEIIREKGTDRSRFFRGEVDKYTWIDVGSSYLPSDILAACLCAQFEARDKIRAKRERMWKYYDEHLRSWAKARGARFPIVPESCEQAYHMFYLLMPSLDQRNRLIEHLKARSIMAIFHYLPLHLSQMGKQLGGKKGDCAVAEDVSERVLRLPFYNDLTEAGAARVVEAIGDFKG
jgi:dTDP-4-amino-4,6-dideoxygalactose transaminase